MAAERNVITIVIQAIDRASAVLRKQASEVRDLEQAERRATPTTRRYSDAQEQLALDSAKATTAIDTQARTIDKANASIRRQIRTAERQAGTIDELRQKYNELGRSVSDVDRRQMSFFEKGRDLAGRFVPSFGEKTRQAVQGSGGGFLGSVMLPFGAGGEPQPPERGIDREQLKLQIADTQTLLNLFPKLTSASATFEKQIAEVHKEIEKLSRAFDRLSKEGQARSAIPEQLEELHARLARLQDEQREWVVTTRDSQLAAEKFARALRASGIDVQNVAREIQTLRRRFGEGPLFERQTDRFFKAELERLEAALQNVSSFDERNDIERQIDAIGRLRTELRGLGVTMKDLEVVGRRLNLPSLIEDDKNTLAARLFAAKRAADALADSLGERGRLGRVRHIFRTMGDDAERVIPVLGRFRIAQKNAFDPADLTRFDETMEIGFRRIARLLAVLSIFLPFITVLISGLLGAVVALVGGVTALAGAFGALAGVLATLPGLFAATYGAVLALTAVLGPALRDISDRFSEIIQLEDQARKKTTENAKAIRDAEEALADVRIQNAQQVANIEQNIADTRLSTAESVADQERDLARLKRDNAEEEMDLVRDLRRAKRDAADDAREAEERYQEVVAQNRADEQDIMRELSARRAALSGAIASGDPAAIAGAQASVSAWETSLRKEQADNRREENAALKAVTDARIRATEEIADLERRIARTKRDNNEQEADAERRLARTRRDSAKQLIELEQQRQQLIAQGIRQERDAMQRLTEARRDATVDIQDSLEGLTKAEKDVVLQLLRIRETWLKLTAATREGGVRFIGEALTALEAKLPEIATGLNAITEGLLGVGREALNRFTSPERWGRFSRILNDTRDNAVRIAEALVEVADGFLTLADAARPLTDRLTRGLRNAAQEFNAFIQEQDKAGGLNEFFSATDRVLTLVVESTKNLGEALFDVLKIAEPFGEILLGDFLEWTEGIRKWTSSADGAKALESFFRDAVPVVESLANFVDELVQSLFRVGREVIRPDDLGGISLLQEVVEDLTGALPRLEKFLIESFRINGPVVIEFLRQFTEFMGQLVGPGGAIVQFLKIMGQVLRAINVMPDWLAKLTFTYLVFHKALISVAAALGKIRLALAGGGAGGGLSRTFLFGIGIAALLAFPDQVNAVSNAIDRLVRSLDRLGQALGLGEGNVRAFIYGLVGLEVAFRVLAGRSAIMAAVGALRTLMAALRTFYMLVRTSEATNIFLKFLDAGITMFQLWRERVRAARVETQKFVAIRMVDNFSSLANTIGLAVDALARYIIKLRETRRQQMLLSFTGGGFGGGGDVFLPGNRGKPRVPAPPSNLNWFDRLLIKLPLLTTRLGRFGLAFGGAIAGADALSRSLNKLFDTDFFATTSDWDFDPSKWAGNFSRNIKQAAKVVGDLIHGDWSKAWRDFNTAPKKAGEEVTTEMRSLANRIRRERAYVAAQLRGLGPDARRVLSTVYRSAFNEFAGKSIRQLRVQYAKIKEFIRQQNDSIAYAFESVQSALDQYISARYAAMGPVPAQAALNRFDRQEALRGRRMQRAQADEDLRIAKRQVVLQTQSLESAERRRARLQERLARATGKKPTWTLIGDPRGGERWAQTFETDPALAKKLRAEIKEQNRIIAQRKKELNDARKHEREVAKARLETLHQLWAEQKRETLQADADRQLAQRAKEEQAAKNRMASSLNKAEEAAKKHDWKNYHKWLKDALSQAGVPKKDQAGYMAGKAIGGQVGLGLSESLGDLGQMIVDAMAAVDATVIIAGALQVKIGNSKTKPKVNVNKTKDKDNRDWWEKPPWEWAAGGAIPGGEGQKVPIMAHAGEWVLNRSQQWRMALMAGMDRTSLERALFHLVPTSKQRGNFAMGGIVPAMGGSMSSTQFLTPININTTSPTVDAEYVARSLESRMRLAAG